MLITCDHDTARAEPSLSPDGTRKESSGASPTQKTGTRPIKASTTPSARSSRASGILNANAGAELTTKMMPPGSLVISLVKRSPRTCPMSPGRITSSADNLRIHSARSARWLVCPEDPSSKRFTFSSSCCTSSRHCRFIFSNSPQRSTPLIRKSSTLTVPKVASGLSGAPVFSASSESSSVGMQ